MKRFAVCLIAAIGGLPTPSMAGPKFEKTITLDASPDTVWRALTDPGMVKQYHFVPLMTLEQKAGGRIEYGADGKVAISGKVIACEAGKKLSHTFRFAAQPGTQADPETTVTYEISPAKDGAKGCSLTLTHSGFAEENQSFANVTGGWPFILDGLTKVLSGSKP